jgi:hypothetical protein
MQKYVLENNPLNITVNSSAEKDVAEFWKHSYDLQREGKNQF